MTSAPTAPLGDVASSAVPDRSTRPATTPDPRFTVAARARATVAAIVFWGNLICQMGIILTGGLVRLTASGLGCSDWPNCEPGRFTPELTLESGIHPLIEFGNRSLTGVLSVFAIGVLLVSWRWLRHKGAGFLRLAWAPLIGTALQALIGMLVVKLHLHPGLVSPHFLISPVIVAFSTILLVRLYEGDGRARAAVPRPLLWLFGVFAVTGFVVLVLGTIVTGTGPHSGDASEITRIPMDPRMASWLHADAVMLFCGLLVGLVIALHAIRARRAALRAAWAMVALTAVQALVGYAQFFAGLPEALVAMHLVGAALFAGGIAWVGSTLVTWEDDPDPLIEPTAATTPTQRTEAAQ